MIQQITFALLLSSALVIFILWVLDCLLIPEKECQHETKVIYDSYHKTICIDCGAEFSTSEIKK